MGYDFKSLSPFDFELVVRDLLQEEFGVRLESFKNGRDQGIDLRYAPSDDPGLIVQCKHYAETGFDGLARHIKNVELSKIRRLAPERYVLATSVPLSPGRKDSLLELLEGYVHTPHDILGAEDLNNLLLRHPQVERSHFKLWLVSTNVLQRILNNEIYVRSLSLRETLARRVRVYVQNESFRQAEDALNKHHVVVIAGVPGIGKSILAEMLMISYIEDDYEPIVVSGDIAEAQRVFSPDARQVFYYDDFLGQTASAEKFAKNEDARLADFMRMIRTAKNKRLILTTREYILAQATLTYERLHRTIDDLDKVVINLANYTRFHRAHILYNHLYFSDLSSAAVESVLHERRYREIINHRNYNPRLIESIIALAERDAVPPADFATYMLKTFANPERIWSHAFENQLSDEAQAVLLALVSLPPLVEAETLRHAAEALCRIRSSSELTSKAFRDALATLTGTFVVSSLSHQGPVMAFHNPSVRDYLLGYIDREPSELRALSRGACYFDQVALLWSYAKAINLDVDEEDRSSSLIRYEGMARSLSPSDAADAAIRTFDSANAGVQLVTSVLATLIPDRTLAVEGRLTLLVEIATDADLSNYESRIAEELHLVLDRWTNSTGHKEQALDLLEKIESGDGDSLRAALRARVEDIRTWFEDGLYTVENYAALRRMTIILPSAMSEQELEETVKEFVTWAEQEVDDLLGSDDADLIEREIDELRHVADLYDVSLDDDILAMWRYDDRMSELAAEDREPDDDDDFHRGSLHELSSESMAIDSLFDSLRDAGTSD